MWGNPEGVSTASYFHLWSGGTTRRSTLGITWLRLEVTKATVCDAPLTERGKHHGLSLSKCSPRVSQTPNPPSNQQAWPPGTRSLQGVAAAAAAKSLRSCPTLCDPIDGSPPGPPSLGFSRQEHWSGLPFPSPMQESEKWKWSCSVVSDSWRPHGLQPTRLLRPWDFPGKSNGVGCHCLLLSRG